MEGEDLQCQLLVGPLSVQRRPTHAPPSLYLLVLDSVITLCSVVSFNNEFSPLYYGYTGAGNMFA